MDFGPLTAANWTLFYPLYINSAVHFIATLRRRTPANGTQPNFAERLTVIRANNLKYKSWGSPPKKLGAKKFYIFYICLVFDEFETLWRTTCERNLKPGKGVGKHEESPTLSRNFMNFGPQTA